MGVAQKSRDAPQNSDARILLTTFSEPLADPMPGRSRAIMAIAPLCGSHGKFALNTPDMSGIRVRDAEGARRRGLRATSLLRWR